MNGWPAPEGLGLVRFDGWVRIAPDLEVTPDCLANTPNIVLAMFTENYLDLVPPTPPGAS